jgi:hypothetical protein
MNDKMVEKLKIVISKDKLKKYKRQLRNVNYVVIEWIDKDNNEIFEKWGIGKMFIKNEKKHERGKIIEIIELDSDDENENYHEDEERSDKKNNKRKREFIEKRTTESRTRKSQKKNKEIIEDDNSENSEIGKEGIELLIEELNTLVTQEMVIEENEEDDIGIKNIKKLAERYYEIEKGTKELVKKWFDFGRRFTQEIETLKDKNNRKGRGNRNKSEIILKKELCTKMLEYLPECNRKTFCNRTNKAIKIYEFFMKVGSERVNRIKNTYVKTIVELNDIQMEQIREQMK